MTAMTTIAMPTVKQTKNLIDGKWVDAASGRTFNAYNPSTSEVIAEVAESDANDVDRAVRAAQDAFQGSWSKFTSRERGKLLYKLADLIEDNADELAALETLNNGKPISEVKAADVPLVIATFRYYAGWADKIYGETVPIDSNDFFVYTKKEAVGVCGQIIPWNFPMLMLAWKWGPALAAGNTIILKPAEQTPLTALRIGELAMEAGFPKGVINIVNGFGESAGDALVKHRGVDKIAFTGHYETAQLIMKSAADTLKRITFELGGKSPNVVFADADMEQAVQGAMMGIFFNQGEVCCAGSRLFVEQSSHDEFIEKFKVAAESHRVGDPFDLKTQQGAQVSKEQYEKILSYIDIGKNEAELVTGGEPAQDKGWFVKPTIFAGVSNDMRIAQEEIFGPVVSVIPFKDHDDLIRQANDTVYGLAAAVWTQNISKAMRLANEVRAGTVWVNCYNTFDPAAPFGGYKFSGHGRECGKDAIHNYVETKTVWVSTK
ncbi:Putative aldehyde dehydrogenase AldA [Poriferisphaera corsica]|uniref:Aldehyde dehydrogenase AldA n=1 Tax=Poriferisphaera corsica TaxID=2528020 RepID=A0A517YTY3_9BACT|nr:aldehyde dehydrogenase family protein [Poriferisphaera corsica]QDU33695.1 Putative aldehyde dehydrogenase AldA [Poriferisphaera corsica]